MESAALFAELENRARHCRRQHRYRETERADADDRLLAVRDLPGSRIARWHTKRRSRDRAKCRRCDHGASEDQHHLVHRRHGHWPQSSRSLRAVVQEGFARAGRQKSEHCLRRRRPGRRHRR